MDRGVVVGGLLISASFLFTVLMNRSWDEPAPSFAPPASLPERTAPAPRDPTRADDPPPGAAQRAEPNQSCTQAANEGGDRRTSRRGDDGPAGAHSLEGPANDAPEPAGCGP